MGNLCCLLFGQRADPDYPIIPDPSPEPELPAPVYTKRETDIAFLVHNIVTAMCLLNSYAKENDTVHDFVELKQRAITELVVVLGGTYMTTGKTQLTSTDKSQGKLTIDPNALMLALTAVGVPPLPGALMSELGNLPLQDMGLTQSHLKRRALSTRHDYHKQHGDNKVAIVFEDIIVRESDRNGSFFFTNFGQQRYSVYVEHSSIFMLADKCSEEHFSALKGMLDILREDIVVAYLAKCKRDKDRLCPTGVSLIGVIVDRLTEHPGEALWDLTEPEKRSLVRRYITRIGAEYLQIESLREPGGQSGAGTADESTTGSDVRVQ